jgi:hypothetical protein
MSMASDAHILTGLKLAVKPCVSCYLQASDPHNPEVDAIQFVSIELQANQTIKVIKQAETERGTS